MDNNLNEAIETVKKGGVIIFPTDTAFGIGCRIDDDQAVERLFRIRKRPENKAVPVLASSIDMVEEYVAEIDPDVRRLMESHWPGGLTIIIKCKIEKIHPFVRGGGDTIGIRIPNHPQVRELIRQVGVPILAPSANFSDGKTPFEKADIDPALASLVDGVIEGECSLKEASTVIDCTVKPWGIIRQGAVKVEISE